MTKHVAEDLPSLDEALADLRAAAEATRASEERLVALLRDRGYL